MHVTEKTPTPTNISLTKKQKRILVKYMELSTEQFIKTFHQGCTLLQDVWVGRRYSAPKTTYYAHVYAFPATPKDGKFMLSACFIVFVPEESAVYRCYNFLEIAKLIKALKRQYLIEYLEDKATEKEATTNEPATA